MIIFASESFKGIRREAKPLFFAHWREVCHDPEFLKLDPDWETFDALEDHGLVHTITARDGARLVGYIVFILQPLLHYKAVRCALEDAHYLMPGYRQGWNGLNMFRFAEEELKKLGVHVIKIHTKSALDKGPVFKRLGYSLTEHNYMKRIA